MQVREPRRRALLTHCVGYAAGSDLTAHRGERFRELAADLRLEGEEAAAIVRQREAVRGRKMTVRPAFKAFGFSALTRRASGW